MKLNPAARKLDAPSTGLTAAFSQWSARHPVLAIVLVSAIALAINCYPVVFLGKSFVVPAEGVPMLYARYHSIPGMGENDAVVEAHGSDTAATMIWGVPLGMIESRSIFDHGEEPLWNRYSHAGDTLIGQANSMFYDPLQWIVIIGRASPLAFDLKFLAAKFLFCIGFGLLIRLLLRSLPLGMVFAALAAWCGAFYYIFNHPVFFVFCYAPWVLVAALEMLNPSSPHYLRWGLGWLAACFGCFNAGHVETAVIIIGAFNATALVFSLLQNRNRASALKIIGRMTMAAILFLALTSPVWTAFLVSLPGSFTIHEEIHVTQFPFAELLGIFDDVFFRLPAHAGPFSAPAPGASFLVLVGCIYGFINWRMLKHELFFWVNTGAILFWGGLVFGWIPGAVIAAIPMLNREGHTHTDFSYLLVMHLTIQCAYGFHCLAREETFRRAGSKLLWTAFTVAALTLLFYYGANHGPVPWSYYFPVAAGAIAAPVLFSYLKTRFSISFWGGAAVAVLALVPNFRFGFYNFGNKYLVTIPGKRLALDAPSTAVNWIKADRSAPFRVTGVEVILFGDWSAVYELENICSSAPVSNGELVKLIRATPGILSQADWVAQVTNVVAAHPVLNLLNVKYILTPQAVEVQQGLGFRLDHNSDLGVLENLEVWPRAYFCDKIVPLASTEQFVSYLYSHGTKPFVAMTPDQISALYDLPIAQGTDATFTAATNYTLLPNSTAFDIHATSAGVVCLTEGAGRDFEATANGKSEPVLTVNRVFKGIYLDKAGDYHIEFRFSPRYREMTRPAFWVALAISLALALFGFLKSKKVETPPNPDIQSA